MLEIGLGIALCIIMAKVASADDESAIIWGSITFLLCFSSLFIPFPFLRVLGAGILSFVLMIVFKMVRDR